MPWHLSASIAILCGWRPNKNTRSEPYFESWRQFIAIMLSAGRAWDWFLIQTKQQQKTTQHIQREKTTITKKQLRGSGPTGRGLHYDVIISISVFRVLKRHCAVMSQILRSWLEQRCREWAQPVSEGSSTMFWNSAESWLPWQHPTPSKSLPHSTSKNNKTNQRKRIMTKISFMK